MNITIKDNLITTLEKLAAGQYQTPEDYASGTLNAYLSSQRNNAITATVVADIETYEPIITAKKEEIEQVQINEKIAYDLTNPVIEQATSTEEIIK